MWSMSWSNVYIVVYGGKTVPFLDVTGPSVGASTTGMAGRGLRLPCIRPSGNAASIK